MKSKAIYLLFIILLLSSCLTTKIEDIKADPLSYIDKDVKVKGRVEKLVNIPFTDYSFLELKDESDNIVVFTLNDHVKGEEVVIKARVVAYSSENHKKSTEAVITSISNFFVENNIFTAEDVEKPASTIGKFISSILKKMEAAYFLIESSDE